MNDINIKKDDNDHIWLNLFIRALADPVRRRHAVHSAAMSANFSECGHATTKYRRSGILLEFHHVGDYVKVSAIDATTNIEASIVGSPRVSKQHLTRLAVRKLDYVMDKKRRADKAKPERGIKV